MLDAVDEQFGLLPSDAREWEGLYLNLPGSRRIAVQLPSLPCLSPNESRFMTLTEHWFQVTSSPVTHFWCVTSQGDLEIFQADSQRSNISPLEPVLASAF